MKQKLIDLFTLTPKKVAFLEGALVGLFITLGIFNMIDGTFFEKNTWQCTTGFYQVLFGSLLIKT